jgi:hypothetical protein
MGRVVIAVALAAYAWTASPSAGWLDSAELGAAAAGLGVAHPPGHPIPLLVGRAAMMLPVGDMYFRMSLASGIAAAIAAWMLYLACEAGIRMAAAGLSSRVRALVAAGGALTFALSSSVWMQAVRAEVYAIEAALVLTAVAGFLRWRADADRRWLVAAALATGLALANHHFVTLAFAVPAAIVSIALRPGWRTAGWCAAAGVLGLVALAYLPLRAQADPLVSWGDATTPGNFVWTVSAQAFQKSLGAEHRDSLIVELVEISGRLASQAGWAAVVPAVIGAWALLRERGRRAAGGMLLGAIAAIALGRALLGFDDDNPDAHGYLVPALAGIVLFATVGLAAAADRLAASDVFSHARRAPPVAAAVMAALMPGVQAARFGGAVSLRGAYASESYARAVVDPAPPGSLLVTGYHETQFLLWALRAIEGARPDVTLIDRNYLTHPFAPAQAKRRLPSLAPLIDAPLRGGLPTPVRALRSIAGERPVAIELTFNLDDRDPVRELVTPRGPMAWITPPPARTPRVETILGTENDSDRVDAMRVVLLHAYLDARHLCATGHREAAAEALERAETIAPGDTMLEELKRSCVRDPG